MQYRILGPLEVIGDDARQVVLPAAKQRAVLAVLLLSQDAAVAGSRLIDALWADPPVSARKVVQTYVSKLRQVLPDGVLQTRATGYLLRREPDDLDATRFERLVVEARGAGPDEAAVLRDALGLWRGRVLEDFTDEPFAAAEVARLESLRLTALVRRVDIDLSAGRHDLVVGELAGLVEENPADERLRGQLMLALYRCGGQAEALRTYRDGRRFLDEELGVDPGPALQRLERSILRQDPALEPGAPTSATGSVVTVGPGTAEGGLPGAGHRAKRRTLPGEPRRGPGRAFVGRSGELSRLWNLLSADQARCVTLTGPAGTGKTRLALEAARRLRGQYADGCSVVDLTRAADSTLVPATLCSALGLHPGRPEHATVALTEHLAARHVLLVLDNFEHVLGAASLVGDLLRQVPGAAFLVTSRIRLGLEAEHVLPVPPLGMPTHDDPLDRQAASDSVLLFLDRARAVRPALAMSSSTVADVCRLCVRLDGLPLALELAAARVDLLSPRGILARLDERLDLLATDAAWLPERHRSLRAAVEWSFDLLDEVEQETFTDLSVFVGGFTVGTAEGVVPSRGRLVVDVVRSLLRANLLRAEDAPGDEPRFGMLESVREYGLARLASSGRADEVRSAHALAFRKLAEQAETELRGPDQARWLDLLQAELPNLRQALAWAAQAEQPDTGLFTAAHLWRFWQVRGLVLEARRHLERLLELPVQSEAARAAGHLGVARTAFVQGDVTAVEAHVAVSLPIHRSHHDACSESFALMVLGASLGRSGEADRGAALLGRALDVSQRAGDAWLEASSRGYLGMVESARGRHPQARAALEDALRGVREAGDSRLVGWFLIGLGRTALASQDVDRARRRFEEALRLERRLGDDWGMAWALQGLAAVAILAHDHAATGDLVARSILAARRAHSQTVVANGLRLLAGSALENGRDALAVEALAQASLHASGHADPWAFETDGFVPVDEARLRATLGRTAYDEHWARGRAMSTAQLLSQVRACL